MINAHVEFFSGKQGKLFRIIRRPKHVQGHVLYLSPLFEQANQTRHMVTRSALNLYPLGVESIIFDHYGTGDSEGELNEASLLLWQQDIVTQLNEIKKHSTQPIILSISLSAALLLTNEILSLATGMILVQAEFNGKRFVQQFKRLALAAQIQKPRDSESSFQSDELAIAGYVMKSQLLAQLSEQTIENLSSIKPHCCWFEWQSVQSELSTVRAKIYQRFQEKLDSEIIPCHFYAIEDGKYWQSTELEIAKQYLLDEQHGLADLISVANTGHAEEATRLMPDRRKGKTIEQAHIFSSRGKQLVAIEHHSVQEPCNKGLIIVVGGPQTRVGSHRLFVYLARALAKQGIHVYRFDYTGAGDSEGEITAFNDIQADITAAIKHFQQLQPQITQLSLWGLCDAASAILLSLAQQPNESSSIHRLILVNPWVKQVHTQAQAYLKSYYIKRLFSQDFWKKLLTGKVKTTTSLSEMQSFHRQSKSPLDKECFVDKMWQGLQGFQGKSHIILSGNDLIADEFNLLVKSSVDWQMLMADTRLNKETMKWSNHTFSEVNYQYLLFEKTLAAILS